MVNVAAALAALAIATTAGTALTIGFHTATRGAPDNELWVWVFVAAGHLLMCGTYALMGESVIEDVAKSGLIAAGGGVLLCRLPLLGLFAISVAVWAPVVNQGLQRVLRK